ncbi:MULTISPECIES: hypothetical protein [Nocardiopsis]|uniref:TrbL/VirB6 plasmid conjugal transfer protein n=2 Tax=Nocardiopsis TaxID=2013 RepID=A0A840WTH7_9ACTN|nr:MULTISPECIES: hypothetical protein [Nocardiopsis]MBB5493448.1 hypothetical protein [Nocardiopsis metallicus]MCK9873061.1 hypothetical protein [Nocardiopsis dassonvillei]MEE2052067.1 hypothetical protein [Nocardiopsis umidischolae]
MTPLRAGVPVLVVLVVLASTAVPAHAAVVPVEVAPPSDPPPTDPEECGLVDYSCRITVGVYLWVVGLIADLINTALTLAVLPALFTPPPTDGIRQAWETSQTVANALYVLAVVAAGVLVMSYQTVQTSTALKEILPRLVLGFVGANASYLLTDLMRELGNGISVNMMDGAATVENLSSSVGRILGDPVGELLTIVLLMLVASLLWFFFVLALLLRILLWWLLTAVAPLALACHALPQTDGLARMWWRSMAALLAIQVGQALVLRIMVTVFLGRESALGDLAQAVGNILDVLLLIVCLYVLVRIPFWAFKQVFNLQSSPVVRAVKTVAALLIFRNIGKALATARAAKATRAASASGRAATVPAPPAPAPRRARVWVQPELPNFDGNLPYRQDPLPGIDRQIDRRAQARLRERRRYFQPPLSPPRPTHWRQDALPQWREPVPRQEPLPQARRLPPPRRRPVQPALFDPPSPNRPRRS